jgi:hypothetical protein
MLAAQLSAGALLLYALSEPAWLYSWRAVFVFGLPLVGTTTVRLLAPARSDKNACVC